jgi:Xaa-Pro aminopeptidase
MTRYLLVPKDEVKRRVLKLQEVLQTNGVEATLWIQKIDIFYLTGTLQRSYLFVPAKGEPIHLIKKDFKRGVRESGIGLKVPIRSRKEIPRLIRKYYGKLPQTLGLEADVLPVQEWRVMEGLFEGCRLVDASSLLLALRSVKSPYELGIMARAGRVGQKVYEHGRKVLKEGMTEIAFAGEMMAKAFELGHEGLLRMRSLNDESYCWHILSGESGGIVSYINAPMGGLGLSPAFPVGASMKPIRKHEPIMVDFGICLRGYQIDETRMFCVGSLPKRYLNLYRSIVRVQHAILDAARPGIRGRDLFEIGLETAEREGIADIYLGPPGNKVSFVGHGIGLEINDPPFIAKRDETPLREGMTFALEPKLVLEGEAAIGIEDTVVVTKNGIRRLTPMRQTIFHALL